MSESVSITIKLCNRVYKIKVAAENESTVRGAAQTINDQLASLKKNIPGRDEQDYLAMALIDQMTSAKEEHHSSLHESNDIKAQLQSINDLLDA